MHGLSCPVACGILVPQPGIKPVSPALEGGFLTTGPPGKSLIVFISLRCLHVFGMFVFRLILSGNYFNLDLLFSSSSNLYPTPDTHTHTPPIPVILRLTPHNSLGSWSRAKSFNDACVLLVRGLLGRCQTCSRRQCTLLLIPGLESIPVSFSPQEVSSNSPFYSQPHFMSGAVDFWPKPLASSSEIRSHFLSYHLA